MTEKQRIARKNRWLGHIKCRDSLWRKNKKTKLAELVEIHPYCWYCGREVYCIDHITPKSKGGIDDINNLALVCYECNMAKNANSIEYFLEYLNHIRSDKFYCYYIQTKQTNE